MEGRGARFGSGGGGLGDAALVGGFAGLRPEFVD